VHPDLERLFDLSGRVALVTGGSRGLGRAMAIGLAQAGAAVVVASRKLDACQAVVDEIAALGGRGLAVAVRMQEPDEVRALVDASVGHFGRLDVVVNNAATVLDRTLEALDAEAFVGAQTVNLLGPMLLVQAAAPHLAEGGHGSVINISSIAASRATPTRYLYPPIKAALVQVTRSLAAHLGPQGVRVNAIMPGTFLTDMVRKAYDDEARARTARTVPLGRLAEPDEIVGTALWMASDASSYLTGAVVVLDGGATA
jgi:NAD(P)-dependent dehydrogenase (short-subunit alcohol dehydrogenase family)